ncbi:four-carbon acid sugar kinase family protein [Sulfitobacter pacificus]|uniref:four-carbon acid sugar kinase family protein n=1 Tax=Sulfitobacter pacificus TaxID=1499314 RepID=UPI0036203B3F
MTLLLGAIADDFTGATDLCNTLVNEGMRAVQIIGVPDETTDFGDADAMVIALKTRTAPVQEAVLQSLAAYDWLVARGAAVVVEKFCSTFDSTPEGNIGAITDALMERAQRDVIVLCPAFPENGRTIYQGHLFVGPDLLSDSSMKDHPLTPMRDASIVRLMEAQSKGRGGVVPLQIVQQGPDAIRGQLMILRHRACATSLPIPSPVRIFGSSGRRSRIIRLLVAVRASPLACRKTCVSRASLGSSETPNCPGQRAGGWFWPEAVLPPPVARSRMCATSTPIARSTLMISSRARMWWPR